MAREYMQFYGRALSASRKITVCATCGSDSIVDSKYGTDDGWCDMCETFEDRKEILFQDYNPLRKDIGEWVEALDGKRGDLR